MTFSKEEIKARCRHLGKRARNFLHSPQCREFLFFLFFVCIASTFWILQTLNDTYETEISVPLKLKNVPESTILTEQPPGHLYLTLKDKGTVLINYMLGQGFIPLTLDFDEYKRRGNRVRIPSSELEKKLLGQLAVSTTLKAIRPDTVEFIYTLNKGKKVPVRMLGNVTAGKQYYIAGRTISPDSVMIYAPQEVLDTTRVVYTEGIQLTDVTDTVRKTVVLHPAKGIKYVPETVELSVFADILTEKTVQVPIKGVDFPADKQLKTFPSRASITFQVGLQRFKDISAEDFVVEVSYNDLKKKGAQEKCRLSLTVAPAGINHVRIQPESVEYLIEQTR